MDLTTINFSKPLIGLDGEPVIQLDKAVTLGSVLAPQIAQQNKGDALKLLAWAMAIYKGEDISLDKSDTSTLKNLIESNEQMTILVKAQLLDVLNG